MAEPSVIRPSIHALETPACRAMRSSHLPACRSLRYISLGRGETKLASSLRPHDEARLLLSLRIHVFPDAGRFSNSLAGSSRALLSCTLGLRRAGVESIPAHQPVPSCGLDPSSIPHDSPWCGAQPQLDRRRCHESGRFPWQTPIRCISGLPEYLDRSSTGCNPCGRRASATCRRYRTGRDEGSSSSIVQSTVRAAAPWQPCHSWPCCRALRLSE